MVTHIRVRRLFTLLATVAIAMAITSCGGGGNEASTDGATSDGGAAKYTGNRLSLVSSSAPGGGEDTLLQMLAPYVSKELGVPVIVEQQQGAEGLIMVNQLYASGDDASRIALMNGTTLIASYLTESEGLKFDPLELRWVSRIAGSPRLATVAPDGPYKSMAELKAASNTLRFPSGGLAGPNELDGAMLSEGGFFNLEIIRGFESVSTDGVLAMLNGDIDFMTGSFGSRAPKVKSGEEIGVFVIASERDPGVPDVPALAEMQGLTDEQKELIKAHEAFATSLTSTFVAAPKIPDDQLKAIETAVINAANNPEFQAEYAKVSANVIDPLRTEETEELARQTMSDAPPEYYDIVKQAYGVE
jgi:tripartite-type tricarboxylate transporter receptor subunit TctC